jgi:hypothetical protein
MREAVRRDETCLTLDVDWAPEEVLASVARLIDDAGLRATLFATHESDVLAALPDTHFEIGLHPRFNGDLLEEEPVRALKQTYPSARGARSHGLVASSRILQTYVAHGLIYESNIFLPFHDHVRPVLRFPRFASIPLTWSDDYHLLFSLPFELSAVHLEGPGLKVLNFHPIHVFMNTESPEHYERFKTHSSDVQRMQRLKNTDGSGLGTLFTALLERLSGRRDGNCTLIEVARAYLESHADT